MRILSLIFLFLLISFVFAEVEPATGINDKTIIWLTDLEETDSGGEVIVNVVMVDNDNEGDGDGGKITLENAQIIGVEEVDWEENCEANNSFQFECVFFDEQSIQWFDFVFSEQDYLKIRVRFEKEGVLILEETGGMECGAYFQTAQTGSYSGFPDGSGGLNCSAGKTFIENQTVTELGGFPVTISFEKEIITESQIETENIIPDQIIETENEAETISLPQQDETFPIFEILFAGIVLGVLMVVYKILKLK